MGKSRLLHAVEAEITPARAAQVMKDVLDIRLDRIDTAEDLAAAGADSPRLTAATNSARSCSPKTFVIHRASAAGTRCATWGSHSAYDSWGCSPYARASRNTPA